MTWVKLDDGFAEHPKVERVGPAAAWLHVAALCYSARNLTDGAIPEAKASRLTTLTGPAKLVRSLVDEQLWHEPGHDCPRCKACPHGHYLIHDYLSYNPSAAKVKAERAAAAERMKKKRRSAKRSGEQSKNNGRSSASPSPHEVLGDGFTSRDEPAPSVAEGDGASHAEQMRAGAEKWRGLKQVLEPKERTA